MRSTIAAACVGAGLFACASSALAEDPFMLYDAKGVQMGRFASPDVVQLTVEGERYMVLLEAAHLDKRYSAAALDYYSNQVYYKWLDCTGRAFAKFRAYGAPYAVVQVNPNGTVTLYPGAEEGRNFSVQSFRKGNGSCERVSQHGRWMPLRDPIDVTALFTRPFTVK